MIPFTRRAREQYSALIRHYVMLDRPEAVRNLQSSRLQASAIISRDPTAGAPAPRPYPQLSQPGQAWVKVGRYWFAYSTEPPLVVTAVFYEAADIPRRIE